MGREELREVLSMRLLSLKEILQQAFGLLNERFGVFMLLTLIVYLPTSLIGEYKMQQVDLSVETMEELLNQMMSVYQGQLGMLLLEMVAILVTAVLVHNFIFGEEKLSFGTAFYRGIRMWLRAVLTMVLLILAVLVLLMMIGFFAVMPGMILFIIPLVLLAAVVFSMLQVFICNAAALRGRMGFDNFRYINQVLKGESGRAIAKYIVIFLITTGISLLGGLMLGNMTAYISNPWLASGMNILVSVVFSVCNIYGYVATSILFLNLEELKRQPETV